MAGDGGPSVGGRLLLALDDSINPKTGKKIVACQRTFDHAVKSNQTRWPWAQTIATVGLVKPIHGRWSCIPLAFGFYLRVEQIIKYYSATCKIEANFHEIKQVIGSAHTQTRSPDALFSHLNFCMAATTITWIYADHLQQAPIPRYASQNTTEYAFADVRRSLAKHLENEGFAIDCQAPAKPALNPLISAVVWLVA